MKIPKIKVAVLTLFILNVSFCVAAYSANYPPELEKVLQKAGTNRPELEKFLSYCRQTNDSLIWKAGCFLLANMDIHYSENYYWSDSLNNKISYNELEFPNYAESMKAFAEINRKNKLHAVVSKQYDIEVIKADYLIKNLERSFLDWKKPINRGLNFDDFCEYLLPYRSLTEKSEDWYSLFSDTIKTENYENSIDGIREITNFINRKLGGLFVSSYSYEEKNNPVSYLSPSQILFRKRGHCEDMVNFTVLAFRSKGIPCRIDMVTYHGTSTGRHFWNATIDENHQIIPFEDSKTTEQFMIHREPAKVISISYSKRPETLASNYPIDDIPDNFLRMRNYTDVTENYWRTSDVACNLFSGSPNNIAYVAVFNGLKWGPTWWGQVSTGNSVVFKNMGCGIVYLPMKYVHNKLYPVGYPVILDEFRNQKTLIPDKKNLRTIVLNEQDKYLKYRTGKKYKLYYWDNKWIFLDLKIATTEPQLIFKNVPENALLLLLPEYSQYKERPFTITSSGERKWW